MIMVPMAAVMGIAGAPAPGGAGSGEDIGSAAPAYAGCMEEGGAAAPAYTGGGECAGGDDVAWLPYA